MGLTKPLTKTKEAIAMDVISMQIANKILRKINRNYNGFYELQTATSGQTDFTLSKEYGFGQHTLGVYVDGAMAYESTDYTEVDSTKLKFKTPMAGGEIILFKTEVAGQVTYPILNPPYDDTAVKGLIKNNADAIGVVDGKLTDAKNRITTTEEKIASIIAVLDADNDGSIVDALADLKTQWESADSGLTALITNKVEKSLFDTLKGEVETARGTYASLTERLAAIVNSIHDYNDTAIKQDISDIKLDIQSLENSISTITTLGNKIDDLTDRVEVLEAKSTMVLKDTVTGWEYNIAVTNGNLVAQLVKILTSVK
jgi:DNA-binding MarR family transcriptional regulator